MGHKVHPVGFRIGIIRDWQSKWYDEQHYASNILEDVNLRKAIRKKYPEAGISLVEIERQANRVGVIIHTARPGIVIGRGGSRVEEMRQYLESHLGGKKVQLDVREIRQPELDALLVARSVAEQMERRVAYRRAMKQSIFRTMQAGAKGMRIICSGRLGGAEIARRQLMHQGRVPLQTLRADIDYGFTEAHTTLGRIGIKVWVYKGDIFPEAAPVIETPIIVEMPQSAAVKLVEAKTEAPVTPNATPIEIKKPRTKRKSTDELPTEAKVEAPAIEEAPKKVARPRVRKVTEEAVPAAKPELGEKVTKPRAVKPKTTESPENKPKTKKAAE
jgi:small subunit ribosomal protein S3